MSNYNHPQIFADLLTLYKMYYKSHQNLPKAFRYTISIEIMKEMTDGLRLITLANFIPKCLQNFVFRIWYYKHCFSLRENKNKVFI